MYESETEVLALQGLLDRSMGNAGPHVRSIFGREHWLSARQVCLYLQGVKQVAAATVTSKGEPRVAPMDAAFFHGRFYLSTDVKSLRARHLAKRPAVSVTYFEGADLVIIAHGRAVFVKEGEPEFPALDGEWVKAYGKSVPEVSTTVRFIRVDPSVMLAYAFNPERFREG